MNSTKVIETYTLKELRNVCVKIPYRGYQVSITTDRLPEIAVYHYNGELTLHTISGTDGGDVMTAFAFIDHLIEP